MELGLIQRHLAYSGGVPDPTSPALKPNQTKQAHNKLNNGRNTSLPGTLRKHLGCPLFQPSLKAHTVFQSLYLTKCISFTNEATENVVQPLLSGRHYLTIGLELKIKQTDFSPGHTQYRVTSESRQVGAGRGGAGWGRAWAVLCRPWKEGQEFWFKALLTPEKFLPWLLSGYQHAVRELERDTN